MTADQMLEEFRLWARASQVTLAGEPIFGKTRRLETEDETLTPPLYKAGLDLKTKDILATFTVWGSGDVSVIIDRTGKELFVDDRCVNSLAEMRPLLDYYRDRIISGGPFERAP